MLPRRSLPQSRLGRSLLRISIITVAVLILLFGVAATIVQSGVRQAIVQQEALRHAELRRSYVLRLQVDEETGLRGFTITGNSAFLAPFRQARAAMPRALGALEESVHAVAPALVPLVQSQRSINETWLTRVARPLVHTRSPSDRPAIEWQGKDLVDRFRALSNRMATTLTTVADEEDRQAALAVERLLISSVAACALLVIALILYIGAQLRMGRTLELQALEFERLHQTATSLQEAVLVEPLPHVTTLSFDAAYAPALEESRVGGDWYGVFPLPDGRIYFSVGDVAGHGVEAAVTMTRTRQTILSIAVHESDPGIILARANDVHGLRSETMVTALCGFVNPQTFEVTYASAGHPPPLLVGPDGEAAFLPVGGAPLGIVANPAAHTRVCRPVAGSLLVLYTDGIVEFDHDVTAGERRLLAVASAVSLEHAGSPAGTIVRRALNGAVQRDDIAVLTVQFNASPSGTARE